MIQKPVPGVVRMIQQYTQGGRTLANVMHVRIVGLITAWTQADIDDATTFFNAQILSKFRPLASNQCGFGQTFARDLTNDFGLTSVQGGSSAGSVATPPLPNNVAICISWPTGRRYKGGHCRTYIPGVPNTNMQDGTTYTSASIAAYQSAAAGFQTALAAHTVPSAGVLQLVTVSRVKNKVVLDNPLVYPLQAPIVDNRIDSQRRRLGRDR